MDIKSLAEPGEVIPWYVFLVSKLAPVTEEDIEWAKSYWRNNEIQKS